MTEILIYALAANETESYMEDLLSTQCKNQSEVDALIERAKNDGFHSFRVVKYVVGSKPDFLSSVR